MTPVPAFAILIGANQLRSAIKMDDPRIVDLSREVAAIRLVLVHILARLSYQELRDISEKVIETLSQPRGVGLGLALTEDEHEAWHVPYREAVDRLLAQAERIRGQQIR
jgi:hypothetical protein